MLFTEDGLVFRARYFQKVCVLSMFWWKVHVFDGNSYMYLRDIVYISKKILCTSTTLPQKLKKGKKKPIHRDD